MAKINEFLYYYIGGERPAGEVYGGRPFGPGGRGMLCRQSLQGKALRTDLAGKSYRSGSVMRPSDPFTAAIQ